MTDIDSRLRGVEIKQGQQEIILTGLQEAVNKNTAATQELTTVLNKSKGAWWALGALAAAVGYALSFITQWVKG